ncbi:MAG: hypothetical protein NZ750_04635 [Anaerolineae bacterium]|nr:hypothetical protein [Anaerolineae bacterium]MDW8171200.1 hypothetical protein [Anaerolineae bacterium]
MLEVNEGCRRSQRLVDHPNEKAHTCAMCRACLKARQMAEATSEARKNDSIAQPDSPLPSQTSEG